jgi:hypothetical protein
MELKLKLNEKILNSALLICFYFIFHWRFEIGLHWFNYIEYSMDVYENFSRDSFRVFKIRKIYREHQSKSNIFDF